jgi:CheY-like chemotaxis protein
MQAQPDLPDTSRRFAERIVGAGRSLLAIVNDILDLSKLEAGEVELSPKPTDIAALAEDVLAQFQPQAQGKSITLGLEAAPTVPALAMADPQALRQILVNLVGNAVKFTEHGQVTMRFSHGSGRLTLAVADTGPGLTPAQLGILFQRFSQADNSTARKHGGTGLGLAISKSLAEAMDGSISVTSELGWGSVFTLEAAAPACDAAAPDGDAPSPSMLKGVRVLIAEASAANRLLARTMIEQLGGEVSEAPDGPQAVEAAAAAAFDIILLDERMPELDGAAAAARIRKGKGPSRSAPILAFCARDPREARPSGFDGAVCKPFTLASLAQGFSAVLPLHSPQGAAPDHQPDAEPRRAATRRGAMEARR